MNFNLCLGIQVLFGPNLAPILRCFFHRYSNLMENWFQCNSTVGNHITIKFCTCHKSTAVVPCAKFYCDLCTTTWMGAEWSFHRIWIEMEKLFVKWSPDSIPFCLQGNSWIETSHCVLLWATLGEMKPVRVRVSINMQGLWLPSSLIGPWEILMWF